MEMIKFDKSYGKKIAGIDEAGRGPLAGPVVSAAVYIIEYKDLEDVNDSKKLTEKKREKLFDVIMKNCKVGIGIADEKEIDSINILNATFEAMKRAYKNLNEECELVLVDGNHKIKGADFYNEPVIKGDAKSLSIAAASIIAKVTRDRLMNEYSKKYPVYGFDKHKGYGTELHREKIKEYGKCEIHRDSFLKKILKREDSDE